MDCVSRWLLAIALGTMTIVAPSRWAWADNLPLSVDDMMRIKNLVEVQISPDGKQVVYVVAETDFDRDAFRFSLRVGDASGANAKSLTSGPADFSPRWSPDADRIAFLSDRGGQDQICVIPPSGGEVECWTKVHGAIDNFNWSPDGSLLAFLAPGNCLEPSSATKTSVIRGADAKPGHQIFLIDVKSRETRRLTTTSDHITGFSWAPDSGRIVYSAQATSNVDDGFRQDLFIAAVKDGAISPLVVREGNDTMPEWSPDGRLIAYQTTNGAAPSFDATSIGLVTPDGKPAPSDVAASAVLPVDDVDAMDWTADSDGLLAAMIDGVESHLYRLDVKTGALTRISKSPGVFAGFSFSKDRSRMAFTVTTTTTPKEPYVSAVDDFEPTRVEVINPELRDRDLGTVERVRWTSSDGLPVEGVLVLPVGFERGKSYPLVTYLHGGPSDSFRLGFGPYCLSSLQMEFLPTQVLAGKGYAVFCPNPRGSRGYGTEFRAKAERDWGAGPLADVLAGIDHLVEQGIADPSRLAIGGHCYGGYLTAWAVSHTDRFRVAMAAAVIGDLTTQYGLSDIPTTSIDYFGGTPWKAPARYLEQSPLMHVDKIKTPLLLHHGEKDERVPLPNGREMYRALTIQGVPTELLIYKNEGHVIGRPRLMQTFHESNLAWLERWMNRRPDSAETAGP